MKILYWGTPEYAVPTLLALHATGHEIVGVVSQPDRRRGRGKQLVPSAVKACAQSLGIPVFTPARIKSDLDCQSDLANLNPDVSVVVAFGQILPKSVLDQPPLGCWNGHGSSGMPIGIHHGVTTSTAHMHFVVPFARMTN